VQLSLRRNGDWIDGRFGAGLGASLLLHGLVILAMVFLRLEADPLPRDHFLTVDVVEALPAVAPSADLGKAEPADTAGAKADTPGKETATAPKRAPLSANELLVAAVEAHTKAEQSASAPHKAGPDLALKGGGTAAQSYGAFGNTSLKDFIRAQVERRWYITSTELDEHLVMSLRLAITPDGTVTKAEVVRDPRYSQNQRYEALAQAARSAAYLSSPLQLPPGTPAEMMDMVLEIDTRDAVR
jgi:hypothetical protein